MTGKETFESVCKVRVNEDKDEDKLFLLFLYRIQPTQVDYYGVF